MNVSYDLDTIRAMGFVEAKPRAASGAAWSEEEVSVMLQYLADLNKGDEAMHVRDPFSFLSHHALLRQKAPGQVKKLLQSMDQKYEPS